MMYYMNVKNIVKFVVKKEKLLENHVDIFFVLIVGMNIFYKMEKKFYVAPAIEIEQIAIEKGFAASTEDPGNFPW